MDEKKCKYRYLKQLIINNHIKSINSLTAACPICVKSRRLSRKNASRERYTHAQKQCEQGLLEKLSESCTDFKPLRIFFFFA